MEGAPPYICIRPPGTVQRCASPKKNSAAYSGVVQRHSHPIAETAGVSAASKNAQHAATGGQQKQYSEKAAW